MKTREEIKANIAHLMKMGYDARTNQFEAEAALRLASKLMAKHAIEQMEIEDATGTATRFDWTTMHVPANPKTPAKSSISWLGMVALGIARFTDTRATWTRNPAYGMCMTFQGDATDVLYSVYLAKNIRDTVRRESCAFVGSRRESETFRRAMVSRIIERMRELKAAQKADMAEADNGGRALVLVSNKVAERDKVFGRQRTGSTRRGSGDAFSAEHGRAAGDRVGFGKPVGSTARAAITH